MNCRRVRTDHRLLRDVDAVESNEAFAAQACVVARDLNCESVKDIPNGGTVSPGHSIGATALAWAPWAQERGKRAAWPTEMATLLNSNCNKNVVAL